MSGNEFEKGFAFSYSNSIDYAPQAVVSKQILKKTPETSVFSPLTRTKA